MAAVNKYKKSKTSSHLQILEKLGFSNDEALVYHTILSSKESTVGEMSRSINFSRAKYMV